MAQVTYRGVKYDTEKKKSENKIWWKKVHCNNPNLTYRTIKYYHPDSDC